MGWHMMLSLYFAALNRARGGEWGKPYTSRGITSALCGVGAGLYAMSWQVGCIVTIGMWFWCVFGWGDYFDFSQLRNNEISIIDKVVYVIFSPSQYADMLAMALRGMFIYPMFAALAVYGYTGAWVYGFVGLLQGIIYWVSYRLFYGRDYVAFAELITGAVLGAALQLSLH
jgi:hypothetical protein